LASKGEANFLLELYRTALCFQDKQLYEYFLDHAVEITKSKIGFFHFVGADQKTILLTSWNKGALENCSAADFNTHYPIEQAGNWADCIRLKRPVIYNDFANSPNQKGFPKGHVPITRMLSVPIIENDKVYALFGVGNKSSPYSQDDEDRLDLVANELNKIVKQRQVELEVRRAKEKYQSLFENMREGFAYCKVLLDEKDRPVDFVYLEVNGAFERLIGLKKESIIGKKVTESIPGIKEANPELFEIYGDVAQSRKENKFEILFKPLNIWLSISVYSPEKNHFAAVFDNITERKKAEQTILESRRDLMRAQSVAKMGSWRIIANSNELYWSDETYAIFEVSKGTPLTFDIFLSHIHPDDRSFVSESWQAALKGEPYDIEHRIIADGKIKWVKETAEHEFKGGKLVSSFGTVQDVTEQTLLRERLEQYTKHLEELVEERTKQLKDKERLAAIGATAGMVGHDIRNPLQAIVSDVYLLREFLVDIADSQNKVEVKESLDGIENNILYINKIVADLQDFARPITPSIKEIDLQALLNEVLLKKAIPQNIETLRKVQKNAQEFNADPEFLKRVLANLVNNAVQAMPNGGKLCIHACREEGNIAISIQDTGVGIPDEVKPKLFTPLFTTKSKGQGFGLAVVKRMTEALNGTVTFESQAGMGTTFTVRFPA
jgi:PAS domain S-box-containing protein